MKMMLQLKISKVIQWIKYWLQIMEFKLNSKYNNNNQHKMNYSLREA